MIFTRQPECHFREMERIEGDQVPEPYGIVGAPKRYDSHPAGVSCGDIHLRILSSDSRGDFYFRQVVLQMDGSDKQVEFGANKVSLQLFPAKARHLILEEHLPLGEF